MVDNFSHKYQLENPMSAQWAILARASGHMVLFTKFECQSDNKNYFLQVIGCALSNGEVKIHFQKLWFQWFLKKPGFWTKIELFDQKK